MKNVSRYVTHSRFLVVSLCQVRVSARIKRKPTRYEVSVVTRDEVGAYKPYLWEQSVFEKGPMFR